MSLKLAHIHGSRAFEDPSSSDIHLLYAQRQLNRGATPYLDYQPYDRNEPTRRLPPGATQSAGWFEYPVGIGAVAWAAAQPANDADEFLVITGVMLAAAALLTVRLLAPTGARVYLFAASPLLLLYAFHNWDMLPVAAVVGAITLVRGGRPAAGGAVLGLGGILKVYPLLLVPAFAIDRWRRGDRRGAAALAVAAGAVGIAANLPVALANEQGWRTPFTFQANRPPDINSVWAWLPHHLTVSHVNVASGIVTAALVVGGAVCVWMGASPVAAAAATVAGTVAIGKVASPQYALWILPFFSLLTVHIAWWAVFTASEMLFWTAFFAQGYLGTHGHLEQASFLRAVVLAVLVLVFMRSRDVVAERRPEPQR